MSIEMSLQYDILAVNMCESMPEDVGKARVGNCLKKVIDYVSELIIKYVFIDIPHQFENNTLQVL